MILVYLVELDNVWVADQLHDINLAIYLGNIMTNCQIHVEKNYQNYNHFHFMQN